MDYSLSDGYSEPCVQCSAVNWGVTHEGQFFCQNCHNVIERTKDVLDESSLFMNSRVSRIIKPNETVKVCGTEWVVCEGFQFILKRQADALVRLGVCMQFKTEVMWNFWMRYLQNTKQAFVDSPISIAKANQKSAGKNETESKACGQVQIKISGSLDASVYVKKLECKYHNFMTMPRTLALLHLALLWVREAITLADLLRMVKERHVPYLNVHSDFPEHMKLFGRDALIFRVESIPSYSRVQKDAVTLAKVMKLPSFPTISQDCLLHPIPLAVRYLRETNLPDELLIWVHKVIDENNMGNGSFLTFDPLKSKPALLCYDIQTAAVIIVSMKLLFKSDDRVEWTSSGKSADEQNEKVFSLRRWFKKMQPAFELARQKMEREEARHVWKSHKPFIISHKDKSSILKRRRVVEHLQDKFQKLTDTTLEQQPSTPSSSLSSFHFLWGDEESADGPSMHHHQLNCTVEKRGVKRLTNRKYWHTALRVCPHTCGDHFSEIESSLPRMYVWLLDLFSFLLGVSQAQVHKEVVNVERRFLKRKRPLPVPNPRSAADVTPSTTPSATPMTLRSRKKPQS